MTTDTAAIRSAVDSCARTLTRLADQLQHLAALMSVQAAPAVEAFGKDLVTLDVKREAVAIPRADRRKRKLYEFKGEQVTRKRLAELAGVAEGTMFQRLRHLTPEQAVEAGPATRGR